MGLGIAKFITDTVLGSVLDIVNKTITNKDEKIKVQAQLTELHAASKLQELDIRLKDKQGARNLYSTTNGVQRLYAIIFLVGYIIASFALIAMLFFPQEVPNIPEWGIGLIGTIFGALSAKVNSITDFFFGSSESSNSATQQVIKNAAKK